MTIADLPNQWESGTSSNREREHEYELTVTLEDAARLRALADLYPDYSEEQLLNDLLSAALKDLPNPARK